jgi:undecaprenyl-phosphate 4-deoxy-4-formamido-L-arabinose transferase
LELSFVIPVYNGAQSIGGVVAAIFDEFAEVSCEVVLVNDGSEDESEHVCRQLAESHPGRVRFLQLSRNFGEHHAVLAGLNHTRGDYCLVLDDDGQNPPSEAVKLWQAIRNRDCDVVYGYYRTKQHHWFRNLGSWLHGRMATTLLKKPKDIYLSSFKVMNRFVVDELKHYRGPFPYIDGLIYQVTARVEQVEVEHHARKIGRSGYTLRKLVRLWLSMFVGFSMAPLRAAALLGFGASAFSGCLLLLIVLDKLFINPGLPVGIPTVLVCIALFSGMQMFVLGVLGEYLGRVVLAQNGLRQYVVREDVLGHLPGEIDPAIPVTVANDLLQNEARNE